MKELMLRESKLDVSEVLKNDILLNILDILRDKNIEVEFEMEDSSFYRGRYVHSYKGTHKIHVNIYSGIKEDFRKFNRRGVLGDVYNPNCRLFIPSNEQESGLYSVIYTILHEYKHHLQYVNQELTDEVDTTLENGVYLDPIAQELEMEAEDFAIENVTDVYEGTCNCFK